MGAYAAVPALAAALKARRTGVGEHIDCSLIETANITGTGFLGLVHAFRGSPPVEGPARTVELPSVEPTVDGWVGFNTNTRQQFDDFLVMIDRADLLGDDSWARADSRATRADEWTKIVRAWTSTRTTDEIVEFASSLRIPVAPVNDGAHVRDHPHFVARGSFAESADGTFDQPLPPYRFDGERPSVRTPRAAIGEGQEWSPRPNAIPTHLAGLPLAGLRILDVTAWWAGPSATQILAALGAEVIHIESIYRPDGGRTAIVDPTAADWWERGFLFHTANSNKLGITLDLANEEGRDIFEQLISVSDAVVENFSPRVFQSFGLTWERLRAINSRLVMVRMPAFGLDGPWRDNVGFAQTIEQISGLAWLTGYPFDQPRVPRGPCDPLGGMHAAFALVAALARRDISGEGCEVEAAMVDAALNAGAEQVIEWSANGTLLQRLGNRSSDAAPQGLYACCGEENWVAISVVDEHQWDGLKLVLGSPEWAEDPKLSSISGRIHNHDLLDSKLSRWASSLNIDEAIDMLLGYGVPAGRVRDPRLGSEHPQLEARGFFERLTHKVAGLVTIPSLPFQFDGRAGWFSRPAPTLGQHNEEVLQGLLGFDETRMAGLRARGVIGEELVLGS
jgi:crotonobetainyl-CoA:carnitine CoA-transferase CaiB-like acyl-CoA transferase